MSYSAIDVLRDARRIANFARSEGVASEVKSVRVACEHLGAVLADSILQSGLNYLTVVKPRVLSILQRYPECTTVSSLLLLVDAGGVPSLLSWQHYEKIERFERLVVFLSDSGVDDANDLRASLVLEGFRERLRGVNGIGPKTIDYMACLVGMESIAVDRHVRSFAREAGVGREDYVFLKDAFCYAADLLELSRRAFDAWLWRRAAVSGDVQEQLILPL